jgi:hypothetical protein
MRLSAIWNLYYLLERDVLYLKLRFSFSFYAVIYYMSPVDFNVDVMQYIVLFFLLLFWYN